MLSQTQFPVASSIVLLVAGSVVTSVLPVLHAASRTGATVLDSVRCEFQADEERIARPTAHGEPVRFVPDVGADGQTFDVSAAVFITRERMDDGVVFDATLHRLEGWCSKCGDTHMMSREGKPLACPHCGVRVRVEDAGDHL